jgi:colicin import membrane protein
MNEAAAIRADIAVVIAATPAIVFADPQKADELFVHIEHEIAAFVVPDLMTDKGRKAVASLAYKIAQTKTAVDAAGKALNEDAERKIDAVNAERNRFKARFEDLQTKARKPLDDWETKEQQRIDYMRRMLKHIEDCGNGTIDGKPHPFGILFRELEEKIVIDDSFAEFKDEAIRAKSVAPPRPHTIAPRPTGLSLNGSVPPNASAWNAKLRPRRKLTSSRAPKLRRPPMPNGNA